MMPVVAVACRPDDPRADVCCLLLLILSSSVRQSRLHYLIISSAAITDRFDALPERLGFGNLVQGL